MKLKLTLSVLMLLTLIGSASATEYYVKISVDTIMQNDGVKSWSTALKYTMNKSEVQSPFGVSINYEDYMESTPVVVMFRISGGSISYIPLKRTEATCIKGQCKTTDLQNSTTGDIRLTVDDIIAKSTSSGGTTTSNSSNPIIAYYYMDKEVPLRVDSTRTFDVATYLSKNDLTQEDAPESVNVFFDASVPFQIDVQGGTFEPKWEQSGKKIKYIIEESSTYTFKVTYKFINPSGWEQQKTDTYKFVTKGLASGGSGTSNAVSAIASYDILVGDSKEVKMSQPGKFTGQEGVTISAQGSDSFVFKFTTAGQYHLKFTTDGTNPVETFVDFNVKQSYGASASAQTTETPAGDTTANQVSNLTGGNNYLILIPLAAIVLGIVLMKRRKQVSRPKIKPSGVQ